MSTISIGKSRSASDWTCKALDRKWTRSRCAPDRALVHQFDAQKALMEQRSPTALGVLDRLDGTLLSDLASMRIHVRHLVARPGEPGVGHLDFALALLSLIASETMGFFTTGATKDRAAGNRSNVNSGGYIVSFIDGFFSSESQFKLISKILADDLRHELVHGFGSRPSERPFLLGLFVADVPARQVELSAVKGMPELRINALILADHVAEACKRVRARVATDAALVDRIASAASVDWPVSQGVLNQFEAVRRRRGNEFDLRRRLTRTGPDGATVTRRRGSFHIRPHGRFLLVQVT